MPRGVRSNLTGFCHTCRNDAGFGVFQRGARNGSEAPDFSGFEFADIDVTGRLVNRESAYSAQAGEFAELFPPGREHADCAVVQLGVEVSVERRSRSVIHPEGRFTRFTYAPQPGDHIGSRTRARGEVMRGPGGVEPRVFPRT